MEERTGAAPERGASRIDIFRHLAVDAEDNHINEPILAGISGKHYSEFVEFCESISQDPSKVEAASVSIDTDGSLHFTTESA
ncbi:MAG: hypothetical protein NC548_05820 [Lachnospiraceae bacterium]|nr:hypothetical protein [Lachnospiraceae bacterium]